MEVEEDDVPTTLTEQFELAKELQATDIDRAISKYREIMRCNNAIDAGVEQAQMQKLRELSIIALGRLYAQERKINDLVGFMREIRPLFDSMPKSKTAKIVRTIIDEFAKVPDTLAAQEKLCLECIAWCKQERRTYLRQRLQSKLAGMLLGQGKFTDALTVTAALTREVKKLDDKQLLVEIFLIESQIHYELQNIPKAKAALTAARTNANAIHVPTWLQAKIDLEAGILHAHDSDFKTAYSYFFESFEAYNQTKNTKLATESLVYMLMSKVMVGKARAVESIVSGKAMLQFEGRAIESMKAVANAYKERSLHALDKVLVDFKGELQGNKFVNRHLGTLSEMLLEENLIRLIEPFSKVEIDHVASLIELPVARVEDKLSQMILDKKFDGILDQGRGHLLVHSTSFRDTSFDNSLGVIKNMGDVVDSLFRRAKQL